MKLFKIYDATISWVFFYKKTPDRYVGFEYNINNDKLRHVFREKSWIDTKIQREGTLDEKYKREFIRQIWEINF